MTVASTGVGQGTATRKKHIGNATWRIQPWPLSKEIAQSVIATTSTPSAQLTRRHSGFASWKRRVGNQRKASDAKITTISHGAEVGDPRSKACPLIFAI